MFKDTAFGCEYSILNTIYPRVDHCNWCDPNWDSCFLIELIVHTELWQKPSRSTRVMAGATNFPESRGRTGMSGGSVHRWAFKLCESTAFSQRSCWLPAEPRAPCTCTAQPKGDVAKPYSLHLTPGSAAVPISSFWHWMKLAIGKSVSPLCFIKKVISTCNIVMY